MCATELRSTAGGFRLSAHRCGPCRVRWSSFSVNRSKRNVAEHLRCRDNLLSQRREQSSNRAASITTKPKRCGQDVAYMPASDTACLTSSAARTACLSAAAQPRLGSTPHASRRWRRGGRTLPRDGVRALRTATTPTSPVRGRLATARGPRGCPRCPGARRWRAGVNGRPPRRSEPGCRLSGAVLDVSPVTSRDRPRLARKQLKIQKETTHVHHSWKRVASMA